MSGDVERVKIGLWVPTRTRDRLKRIAEKDYHDGESDRVESVPELIRQAVREYLIRRESHEREDDE